MHLPAQRLPLDARRFPPYILASLLILVPCFWQSRMQAGDLSSHIYNAWLVEQVEAGRAPGLAVVPQFTNILFDLLLTGMFRLFGAAAAQRIAVSLAVLVFVWGAFAFARAVSGLAPWHLLPLLAMLAYGWVYHMGFFNFYLSLGLCMWVLALLWTPRPHRIVAATPLVLLACLAHPLPVFWSLAILAYVLAARPLSPLRRALFAAACLGLMGAGHSLLRAPFSVRWSPWQICNSLGLEQVWVFDVKYVVFALGLLALWAVLFARLLHLQGLREVLSTIPFQICFLGAAAVVLLPEAVRLPGAASLLGYIPERMSLTVVLCSCALLAAVPPRRADRLFLFALASLFFLFLYRDERIINALEDRVGHAVAVLPAGSRIVMPVADSAIRANPWWHILDRACLGHCLSYGNYEPATLQFRVRAKGRNAIVTASDGEAWLLRRGGYVVRGSDLPLFQVEIDSAGNVSVRPLHAADRCDGAKLAL